MGKRRRLRRVSAKNPKDLKEVLDLIREEFQANFKLPPPPKGMLREKFIEARRTKNREADRRPIPR